MAIKEEFTQVVTASGNCPKSHDGRMRVPARIYGNEDIFDAAFRDKSVEQLVNVSMLPGIVGLRDGDAGYAPGLRLPHRWRGGVPAR